MPDPGRTAGERDFRLVHRGEIIAVLERLHRERVLTTVEFGAGHAIVSSVLEVRRDVGALVFDVARDPEQTRHLFAAQTLSFLTELDHIQIAFETHPASLVSRYDGPAALVDLPQSMVRLQRREWFRVGLPVEPPIRCTVLDPHGNASPARAVDLSCGGAGVMMESAADVPAGAKGHELILNLPDVGRVELDATPRNQQPASTGKVRIGFRFEAMPPKTANQIQRYVQRLEIARLAAARGR